MKNRIKVLRAERNFTQADLALPRLALALASVLVLLVGLVMEGDA